MSRQDQCSIEHTCQYWTGPFSTADFTVVVPFFASDAVVIRYIIQWYYAVAIHRLLVDLIFWRFGSTNYMGMYRDAQLLPVFDVQQLINQNES